MADIQNLNEQELQNIIEQAQKTLKDKQANKRKEIMAEIKALAASIDVKVEIIEASQVSSPAKVQPKYRHPKQKEMVWTGRGIKPRWIKELLEQGKKLEEFLIKH